MAGSQETVLSISIPLNEWFRKGGSEKNKGRIGHLENIKRHVCALLNTSGGKLILKATQDDTAVEGNTRANTSDGLKSDDVVRAVEQIFQSVIGTSKVSSHFSIHHETSSEILLKIRRSHLLCTLCYNMFLPSATQVLPIQCTELDTVRRLLNIHRLIDVTEFENARKIPSFDYGCRLNKTESKILQFKCLKCEKTKCNNLASRIINNKFTSYVSAFANDIGGQIYVGIDKSGTVLGETVTADDRKDIEATIEKHVNNMIWPEDCRPPEKGMQWDLVFHPVNGRRACLNSSPVEAEIFGSKLCVIVITIYACRGGVFVKKPESYHIVENRVVPMEFTKWRAILLDPENEERILRTVSSCDWSSWKLRKQCDALDGKLLRLINFGKWAEFQNEAQRWQPRADDADSIEVELVLLSKWYVYYYRKGEVGDFARAENIMKEFERKSCKSKDALIFQIRGLLCFSALQRTLGYHERSYRTARNCLSDVEKLSPCILTAEFYVHFATMLTIIARNESLAEKLKGDLGPHSFQEEAMTFYNRALQHLRAIEYVPMSKADMQQKCHINIAILKLGCCLSGDMVDRAVSKEAIEAATTCLTRVATSILQDGNPLSGFRACHHDFATSSLHYRRSQHEPSLEKRVGLLESAVQVAEEVEFRAASRKFHELSKYATRHIGVYRKELAQLSDGSLAWSTKLNDSKFTK